MNQERLDSQDYNYTQNIVLRGQMDFSSFIKYHPVDIERREEKTIQDLIPTQKDKHKFEGQQIEYFEGMLKIDPRFSSPLSINCVFEVRKSSNIIFLILDSLEQYSMFKEMRTNPNDGFSIGFVFSPTYKSICDFIRYSDSIITVQSPTSNPKEKIKQGENIPVESVRMKFQYKGERKSVRYSDGSVYIPVAAYKSQFESLTKEESFREYIIQIFENIFSLDKDFV